MCGSMADIESVTAEIRRGKKEDRKKKKPQGKNMGCPIPYGGHKYMGDRPMMKVYHVDDLLKRFGFAPVGFQIVSLGDCDGLLAAADEFMFRSLLGAGGGG